MKRNAATEHALAAPKNAVSANIAVEFAIHFTHKKLQDECRSLINFFGVFFDVLNCTFCNSAKMF